MAIQQTTTPARYQVLVAAGCYTGATQPVISTHATLDAAVRAARRSDRLEVQRDDSTRVLYRAAQRGDARLGAGAYGNGPGRGEPTLDACIRAARAML